MLKNTYFLWARKWQNNPLCFAGHMLIVGGNDGLKKVELFPQNSSEVPDFQLKITKHVGAQFGGNVLICGGQSQPSMFHKECYIWNSTDPDGAWIQAGLILPNLN